MLLSADMDCSSYFLIEGSTPATGAPLASPHLENSSCPASSSPLLATSSPSCSINSSSNNNNNHINLSSDNLEDEQQRHSPSSQSSFNYDPFDGFSSFLLDQHYYSGSANSCGAGLGLGLGLGLGAESCDRNSSTSSASYAMDPLDHTFAHQISSSSSPCLLMMHQHTHSQQHHNHNSNHHHHNNHHGSSTNNILSLASRNISASIESSDNNFSFQTDPDQEDAATNDLPETLTSFVADLGGVESDAGYNSGVDLFGSSHTTMIDVDSPEAYYLKLALEHQQQQHLHLHHHHQQQQANRNNCDAEADSDTAKRSVLMNLLINGSDASAGYIIHNCRAQH